jgi:hypothetical protein
MMDMTNAGKAIVEEPEKERKLERHGRRWKDRLGLLLRVGAGVAQSV